MTNQVGVVCYIVCMMAVLCVPLVQGQTSARTTSGWFGNNYQNKCHCNGDSDCDRTTGECTRGCAIGWFGPACQYADLTTTSSITTSPSWLYDGDDNTCNYDTKAPVTIQFNVSLHFTWLRLNVKNPEHINDINVEFKTSLNSTAVDCRNMKTVSVSDRTLDIHCDVNELVQEVIVTGQGVESLCSVYISGGRNIALKQPTTQSSTYRESWQSERGANVAVDGNRDGNWYSGSCTQTAIPDIDPTWSISFTQPETITRYVLYNRNDAAPERLLYFNLTSYTKNNTQVFTYQDENPQPQDVYTVLPDVTSTSPVSRVTIRATHVIAAAGDTTPVLTLCEVEMYGDTACLHGSYGIECEHSCDYCRNHECFVSNGGCPDGCLDGYEGDRCQTPCPATYYGQDCSQRCSTNCTDQQCNKVNGVCDRCEPGKHGSQCEMDCPHSTYGHDCIYKCNTNCVDQLCDKVNGTCEQCPPGKIGDQCNQDCNITYYGEDCQQRCSTNCSDQLCDKVNGSCNRCIPGKRGAKCDQDCHPGTYGQDCTMSCSTVCVDRLCDKFSGKCDHCQPGKTGDQCDQDCQVTYYGQDCQQRCSINCVDQLCDNVTGKCDQCVPGKTGEMCSLDCPRTKYGQDCLQTCSINCVDQDCNPVSGGCLVCPPGKTGDQCDQVCAAETYGQECLERCSEHCASPQKASRTSCDPVNGTCFMGCVDGYVGPLCLPEAARNNPSSESNSSDLGVGIGIGAGLMVVVVVAVVVGVYCYRKRSHNTRSGRQRPSGYEETDFHNQDDNTYRELFKGIDDYNLPTDEAITSRPATTSNKNRAAYENTVVNPYHVITEETSRGEPDGGYVNVTIKTSGVDETDGGYANCVVKTD